MPMTELELQAYLSLLAPMPVGCDYVRDARSSPPAREVHSGPMRNTPWRFASQKMGVTISGEGSLERNYHVLLEFDPEVIEYWEQPPTVPLLVKDKNGHSRRVPYTPDVLVLTRDSIYVIQVKTAEKCRQLVHDQPERWSYDSGIYCDDVAARHFKSIGLIHRVVTDEAISSIRAANLLAIARADSLPRHKDYRKIATHLLKLISEQRAAIAASAMSAAGISDATTVLQMLADKLIVANLEEVELGSLHKVWLAIDAESIESVREVGRLRCNAGRGETIKVATGKDAQVLLQRIAYIKNPELQFARSIRRWKMEMKRAGGDIFSLMPNVARRGNRKRRVTQAEIRLIENVIETHFMSPLAPTVAASYRRYLNVWDEARAQGQVPGDGQPVSEPTFRAEIQKVDLERREQARGGSRAANAAAQPVPADKKEPRASRPFERGHIDHYLADIHTVISVAGAVKVTRRLWVTVLRDECSGAVLGISVRLREPSRVACALVLRDCVRRHGRLPETIVVDNGKEFGSTYFEVLLARYGVSKQSRPPGAPRFGASIESFFKSLRDFLRTLPGSTSNDDRGRAVSAKFRGQAQATLDTDATYAAIEQFCFEGFNMNPLRGRYQSPQQLLGEGLCAASYSGIPVELNQQFLVLSAIPTGRRPKIDPKRGIRHLGRWFYAPDLMKKVGLRGVEVLAEPWDESRIYAVIDGKAVVCYHGRASESLDYSVASMLRAMVASEAADIRAKNEKTRGKQLDKIVANVVKGVEKKVEIKEVKSSRQLLPPLRGDLKPFRAGREGGS